MPPRKLSPSKRDALKKAREEKMKQKAFKTPILGFYPALKDRKTAPLHTFVDVHPGAHPMHAFEPVSFPTSVPELPPLIPSDSLSVIVRPQMSEASSQTEPFSEPIQTNTEAILKKLKEILLFGFNSNSPERRLFIEKLTHGLHERHCSMILGISPKSIQRARADLKKYLAEHGGQKPLLGEYHPKQKRQRMDPQRHQLALGLLDILAPVQSGHTWRVVRTTQDFLYEQYKALVLQHNLQPVCKEYFIDHILDKEHNNIHFENQPELCPLCERHKELSYKPALTPAEAQELVEINEHIRKRHVQWQVYHGLMTQLKHNTGMRLIVQDFNQQSVTKQLHMQVLSIVLYEASAGNGVINRHFFNYFLPVGVSNDMLAVIACHRIFFNEPLVKNATNLSFWSDGGPKHFKLTANLAHMSAYARTRFPDKVTLNFFASYHGSGPADAAAAHIKNAIVNKIKNFHFMGPTVADLVRMLGRNLDPEHTTCAEVVISPDLQKILVDTAVGLKAIHRFEFFQNNFICGWADSAAPAPIWIAQLQLKPGTGPLL
jgi:hypothetical protein